MKLINKIRKMKYQNRNMHNDDIVDVPVYGPYDNILPVPYEVSGFFATFENTFEIKCREFLKKTYLDKYNKGYMDSLIDEMVEEAIELLDVQEVGHKNAINHLTRSRVGTIRAAEDRLDRIPKEKGRVEAEITKLENIYYKGTAYETVADTKGGAEND